MRHCLGPWDSMQRSIDHQPINSFKPTLLNCRRASKCAARQKKRHFFHVTRGLGKRDHDPTQDYWNSLRPTEAKVFEKYELWLELA